MNPAFSDVGIVIKSIDFGEADRLVNLVTKNHGLISLVAKGARKITSKKAPHLDLLNLVKIQTVRGRRPQILTQAELIKPHPNLKNNLKMARTSFYLTEILNSLLALDQPDQELFYSLKNYLFRLNQLTSTTESRRLSTDFQLYLLRHLGFPQPQQLTPNAIISHFEQIIDQKLLSRRIL